MLDDRNAGIGVRNSMFVVLNALPLSFRRGVGVRFLRIDAG